jgi:dUTP pyrophosphatase
MSNKIPIDLTQDENKGKIVDHEMEKKDKYLPEPNILYVELLEGATAPFRSSENAIGYDLYSNENHIEINPREKAEVKTGVKIFLPSGTYGRIAPRSGLAVRHSIDILAGVIDPDYQGELIVCMFNHADVPFIVKKNDKIAQLILEKALICETKIVKNIKLFGETNRGEKGFGSTG